MDFDINLLVFDRFRYVERLLRTGRVEEMSPFPPGHQDREKTKGRGCADGFPRREILLLFLMMHRDGVRQKAFADEIRVSPSTVSEMVVRLAQDGYVEQKHDTGDRRVKCLVLTEKGEARARRILDEFTGLLGHMFGHLDRGEKEELIRLLDKMLGMEHAAQDRVLCMTLREKRAAK